MKPMLSSLAPADMLAIKYPIAAEIKYDGVRTIAVVNKNVIKLYSRNGRYLENFEEIKPEVLKLGEGVYDGEVISPDGFQALMTRTHAEPGKNTDIKIEYKIFDKLTINEWIEGYSKREYQYRCKDIGERVIIKNPVDLEIYYNHVLKSGHEGLILKAINSPYESGNNRHWFKLKPKDTIDLKIIGYDEGTGKLTGMLGALCCLGEYNGVTIHSYVGTGFTDEQRQQIYTDREKLMGKYIEVEFQEMTKADKYGARSLRSPVFKCLRLDK